jgi:hypothetical protein
MPFFVTFANMKVLTLGDIHGRDKWMFHTHGSPYEFNLWKISVENGAPGDNEFWNELPYMEYDKIIFVGDYVDSFDMSNKVILRNLKNIIFFKRMLPDKVVLLLGNHDVQYIVQNEICSGYRSEMRPDLSNLFNDNKDIFQLAYQENSEKGIHLWTHAGVTREWLRDTKREIFSPKYRLYPIIEEYENSDIADLLNILWEIRNDRIFNIDSHSGGFDLWAGPIWVRPDILNHFHIEGVNQIVGHTPHKALRIDELVNSKHYYVDRLFGKDDEVLILDL